MKRPKLIAAIVFVAGVIAVVLVAGSPPSSAPLSPTSYQSDGTRALVDLMDSLGSSVTVLDGGAPPEGVPAYALVLSDSDISPAGKLGAVQRQLVESWAASGGHLVVADPESPLDSRAGVTPVDGAGIFTNGALGRGSNAAEVARLLGAGTGDPVYLVFPSASPGGSRTLMSMLDTRTRIVLGGLILALAVWAVSRARRLGEPVGEAPMVAVEGSALVEAMGQLAMRAALPLSREPSPPGASPAGSPVARGDSLPGRGPFPPSRTPVD